jgi:hypothetical protein
MTRRSRSDRLGHIHFREPSGHHCDLRTSRIDDRAGEIEDFRMLREDEGTLGQHNCGSMMRDHQFQEDPIELSIGGTRHCQLLADSPSGRQSILRGRGIPERTPVEKELYLAGLAFGNAERHSPQIGILGKLEGDIRQ